MAKDTSLIQSAPGIAVPVYWVNTLDVSRLFRVPGEHPSVPSGICTQYNARKIGHILQPFAISFDIKLFDYL